MTEKKIGYAYAGTANEIDAQTSRLEAAGCSAVFSDLKKKSGFPFSRQGLKAALAKLQHGDTLVVCAVDRLSRDMSEKLRVVETLMSRGIEFDAIDDRELAHDLQHRVNYAPDPSPRDFVRYAAFRLGDFLVRYSRRGLILRGIE